MMRSIALAASCLFLALVGVAHASNPAGLYVLVEDVELDPGKEPKWIKIRGVFMNEPAFDDNTDKSVYGPVQGWAFFRLPDQQQDLARLEWKDIRSAKGSVVALGSAYALVFHPSVTIHIGKNPQEAQQKQVAYPVGHGMYLLREKSAPAIKLLDFRKSNPAPK
jgi:hypothetical protein